MAASKVKELLGDTQPATSNTSPSPSEAAQVLTIIRSSHLHRPSVVLQLGDTALSHYRPSCREYWDIAADICRAASEVGEDEIATSMLDRIMRHFPKSNRTHMLRGLYHEARGAFTKAMSIYMLAIADEPMSPHIYKRQVALLKSDAKLPEAVALLNYYLSLYAGDTEAWAELCALCLRLHRFAHALFAASELVMTDTGNHAYHTLLADVYLTSGPSPHNVAMARAHYVASVNARKSGNLRALYGIWLACRMQLDGGLLQHGGARDECANLLAHTKAAVTAVYLATGQSHQQHVHTLLEDNIVDNK